MLDVLQIGASRAGSTWLWRMFQKHPQIVFPCWGPNAAPGGGPAYSRKSAWFWNSTSLYWKDNHWGQIKSRAVLTLDDYRKWYDASEENKVKMDITEGAAYIPNTRIQLIRETYPDVKIVYCIRNPITATWSHMRFSSQQSADVQQFLRGRGGNYKRNVDYLNNLKQWKNHFPEEQIKVYFFKRIKDNPIGLLEELTQYIGVDDTLWKTVPRNQITTVVNPSTKSSVPNVVRKTLATVYEKQIREMEQHFNADLSQWLDGKE